MNIKFRYFKKVDSVCGNPEAETGIARTFNSFSVSIIDINIVFWFIPAFVSLNLDDFAGLVLTDGEIACLPHSLPHSFCQRRSGCNCVVIQLGHQLVANAKFLSVFKRMSSYFQIIDTRFQCVCLHCRTFIGAPPLNTLIVLSVKIRFSIQGNPARSRPGFYFGNVQQQSYQAALWYSKAEPVDVIRRRDIKRLRELLIERRGAVPSVIVLNRFRRNQRDRRRADFLAGAVAQSDVVKPLFVEFPIQIVGAFGGFAPNCFCRFPIFCKILPGINTGKHPSAVRADVQRHVIFRNSKAEPVRITAA